MQQDNLLKQANCFFFFTKEWLQMWKNGCVVKWPSQSSDMTYWSSSKVLVMFAVDYLLLGNNRLRVFGGKKERISTDIVSSKLQPKRELGFSMIDHVGSGFNLWCLYQVGLNTKPRGMLILYTGVKGVYFKWKTKSVCKWANLEFTLKV